MGSTFCEILNAFRLTVCILQTGKWSIWPFLGLKRVCTRGIWDYEGENYIFRCALLK